MKEITLRIKYCEYETVAKLKDEDRQLILKARDAAKKGYAPYSGFQVGAAVLLQNGKIFTGNNQENAAFPSGLCAERTALFYAASQYPGIPIIAIAVSAFNRGLPGIAKPCGGCRQVMAEYEDLANQPMHIILDRSDSVIVLDGIENLLPLRFKKGDLE